MKNQLDDQYQGEGLGTQAMASVTARVFSTLAAGLLAIEALVVPTPAASAQCRTDGQSFYIDDGPNAPRPGFNYTSGFEGNRRYGIFLLTVTRGDKFRLAGNGILPNSNPSVIQFTAEVRATGQPAAIFGRNGQSTDLVVTSPARSNCVVQDNDIRNSFVIGPVPNGKYRIKASYAVPEAGTVKFVFNEPVIDLNVKNSR
jgi:hypothetical protein